MERPRGSTTLTTLPGCAPPMSVTSLWKIHGCPEAARSAALRLTRTSSTLLSHGLQAGYAVLGRRMRRKQLHERHAAAERLDDEHVGGGGRGVHGDALRPVLQFLQRRDQAVGSAGVFGGRGVGIVFAGAGDR